ncbi:MAG: hypothetical protein ACJAYG_002172 [Oceanicoccus sp.]|jgi:hypothetical protein
MRFNELSINIGKKITLRTIGLDYKKHKFDARIIGYIEGKSLMLSLASKPGQVLLQTGQSLSLELQLPIGTAFCDTEIEAVHESPSLYLVVDYPLGVNFEQQRQQPRLPVDTPVEVSGHTGMGMITHSISGFMLDVSSNGARIVLEKELTSMVTKVDLGVMLVSQGLERDISIMAEVRNTAEVSADYPSCGFAYGLEFIELEDINNYFLQAYCLQEVARGRALLCNAS